MIKLFVHTIETLREGWRCLAKPTPLLPRLIVVCVISGRMSAIRPLIDDFCRPRQTRGFPVEENLISTPDIGSFLNERWFNYVPRFPAPTPVSSGILSRQTVPSRRIMYKYSGKYTIRLVSQSSHRYRKLLK